MNGQQTVDAKAKSFYTNYFKLMLECAKDEETRKKFMATPGKYMDQAGMKIPEKAQIRLDSKNLRWPVVYIKTEEGKIAVAENKLAMDVLDQFSSERELLQAAHKQEHFQLKEWGEVDVNIHQALQEGKVVVNVPFYDVQNDILTEVKFNDGAEIILTAAC